MNMMVLSPRDCTTEEIWSSTSVDYFLWATTINMMVLSPSDFLSQDLS